MLCDGVELRKSFHFWVLGKGQICGLKEHCFRCLASSIPETRNTMK